MFEWKLFIIGFSFLLQALVPDVLKGKTKNQKRKDHGQRLVANSWHAWNTSSQRIVTWRKDVEQNWRENWVWTRRKSRSGSRTNGPRSRRQADRRTRWLCSWWHRDCITTVPYRWPEKKRNRPQQQRRTRPNSVTLPRPKTYLPFLWFETLFILGIARLLDIGVYSWVVLQLLGANGIK